MTASFENDARFAYLEWLAMEARLLRMELFGDTYWVDGELTPHGTFAGRFHLPLGKDWREQPKPSSRATLVLVAVGVVMPLEDA